MAETNKITLKDLAQRLNVSKVTISKALRGHPDISIRTAKLVKKTAEDLGYIPNIAARNLSSGKTNTIGLVVPKIAHSFFSSLIESIYKYAAEKNYEIVLTASQENPVLEQKHLLTMLSMRVDGILISVTNKTKNKNAFYLVEKNRIPLVQIDRTLNDKFSRIVFDDIQGSYRAVKYAADLGYKKFAFIGGNHKLHIGRDRLDGFRKALRERKIPVRKHFVIEGGFKIKDGYDSFIKLHEGKKIPEIIFAVTYPVALGVFQAAKELGLMIPRDVDLISFGDSEFNKFISPAISCINQDTDTMAKLSVNRVIREIEAGKKLKPKTIKINSEFMLKETCKREV